MTTTLPAAAPRPPDPPERPASYRDPLLLAERRLRDFLAGWGFVVLALLGDLAAFYIVLAVLFEAPDHIITAVALGFASGAIALTHAIGKGLAERRCADQRSSPSLLGAAIAIWLLLGIAAFLARYGFAPEGELTSGSAFPSGSSVVAPAVSGDASALMAAGLFGALYLASGLGAIYVSYRWFNPLAEAYTRATRRLAEAVTTEAASLAVMTRAQHVLYQHEQENERESERWRAAREQAIGLMFDLQNYARNLMAAGLQDPAATDGLAGNGPRPLGDDPQRRVIRGELVQEPPPAVSGTPGDAAGASRADGSGVPDPVERRPGQADEGGAPWR